MLFLRKYQLICYITLLQQVQILMINNPIMHACRRRLHIGNKNINLGTEKQHALILILVNVLLHWITLGRKF